MTTMKRQRDADGNTMGRMRMRCIHCAAAVLIAVLMATNMVERLCRREFKIHQASEGRVNVVISGASTGIGRHACLHLLEEHKHFVLYCGVRTDSAAQSLLQAASDTDRLFPVKLDVTNMTHIARLKRRLEQTKRPLLLVNNAGVAAPSMPVEFVTETSLRSVFDVNYFGAVSLTQALLPNIRESKGRIVNIGSIVGVMPGFTGGLAYASSKHCLESFTDTLRQEMAPHEVSVSIIEPGTIISAIQKTSNAKAASQASEERARALALYPYVLGEKSVEVANRVFAKAESPVVTSQAISHALTDLYPQTRYVVSSIDGTPAWVVRRMFWLLPDRVADFLVANM